MAANGIKPRILFVDDEQRVLNSMRVMFRRDYELHLTTRGDEALQIIDQHSIDVIVADQRMPIMSGVEVLNEVKDRSPRTVRILLTGYADLDAMEGAINRGEVFRFLTKPCAPEELRETIKLAADIALEDAISEAAAPEQLLVEEQPATPALTPEPAASAQPPSIEEQPTKPTAVPESAIEPILLDEVAPQPPPEPQTAPPRKRPVEEEPGPPVLTDEVRLKPSEPELDLDETGTFEEEPVEEEPTVLPPGYDPLAETASKMDEALSRMGAESNDDSEATTIVMEGDTVKVVSADGRDEKRPVAKPSAPARSGKPAPKYPVGVLVYTDDALLLSSVREALAGHFQVVHASNIVKVTKVIAGLRPGVLVTDVSDDPSVIEQMVGTLKQHLPELVTIVVGEHRDTVGLVNLINHGQVFRFMRKPLAGVPCLMSIKAAAKKHLLLRKYPELAKRYAVRDTPSGDAQRTLTGLISKLKGVRKLWGSRESWVDM